jgi:UDP-N-acetylglucosamine:LPS N-acetylglucosamine transferase
MKTPYPGKAKILLIDNLGLSHYTSYLALGLAKDRNIILYGISKDDFVVTGASQAKNIEFHGFLSGKTRIPKIVRYLFEPLLFFLALFRILTKEKYDIVHVQGHLPMFFLFIPTLKLKKKLYAGLCMMCT